MPFYRRGTALRVWTSSPAHCLLHFIVEPRFYCLHLLHGLTFWVEFGCGSFEKESLTFRLLKKQKQVSKTIRAVYVFSALQI